MKKIIQLEGNTFIKLPYENLIASYDNLVTLGWKKIDLGTCSDSEHHIYALMYGDSSNPTIMIEGGIHGLDEWPNDYWVRDFAGEIISPTLEAHKKDFSTFRANFHFIIIPCLNPYGYINRTRWNANGVDINRNFDYYWDEYIEEDVPHWGTKGNAPFDQPEALIVKTLVETYKPIMFHDCHGWGSHAGIGISQLGCPDNAYYDIFGADIQKTLNISVEGVQSPIYQETLPKYIFAAGSAMERRPTAASWVSLQQSKNGIPIISSTTEISVSYYPEEYTYQQRYGKSILYVFCLYCLNYYKNKNLILRH